ncbi:MAG: hypothetical protein AB1814_07365 [Thermodesulfobacteriota bacterium]
MSWWMLIFLLLGTWCVPAFASATDRPPTRPVPLQQDKYVDTKRPLELPPSLDSSKQSDAPLPPLAPATPYKKIKRIILTAALMAALSALFAVLTMIIINLVKRRRYRIVTEKYNLKKFIITILGISSLVMALFLVIWGMHNVGYLGQSLNGMIGFVLLSFLVGSLTTGGIFFLKKRKE